MDFLETIVLGIIQGLTEFLPVSSSGHLELAKAIFGGEVVGEESMMTTVVLHIATALSTVVVFRKDVAEIFSGFFKFKNNEAFNFSMKIILSMIPAALVGFFLDDVIETFLTVKFFLLDQC
jgi:undecaprenyl-diphosphatase